MTGVVSPREANAPSVDNERKNDTIPKIKRPSKVANVIFTKSFILNQFFHKKQR